MNPSSLTPATPVVRVRSYEPHARQIAAHLAPERFVLYGGAMGGGKSVWLCNSAVRACLRWPGSRWYLARKEHRSFMRTTALVLDQFLPAALVETHHETKACYTLRGGSQIWYGGLGTQDDREKIKSMELSGFGIDEASEVEEAFFLMLSTRLRLKVPPSPRDGLACRYQGLLASNPEPGWLRTRFIDSALPDHRFVPALPRDNPHLPWDYERNLRTLFAGTPAWEKAYLDGDWDAFGGTNFVLRYADVRDAMQRTDLRPDGEEAIGCDVARFGDDETAIGHRTGPVLDDACYHGKEDTMTTAGRVVGMYRRHPKTTAINIDDDGVGGGVVDRVREVLKDDRTVTVNGVHFGGRPRDREHFADWASEVMSGALGDRFRTGLIQLPADEKMKAQLTARLYAFRSSGQVKIESKDEMKKRGLASPDRADMLMCCFAPGVAPWEEGTWS
jgi:hypothetical protein